MLLSSSSLYEKIQDEVMVGYHNSNNLTSGEQLFSLPKKVCKDMNFFRNNDVSSMFEEYTTMLSNIHNKYTSKDYEEMYKFLIDQDLYKSFVYLYFYIRPVKMFISRTLIKNSITSQFACIA